jgi:hypothetical protein
MKKNIVFAVSLTLLMLAAISATVYAQTIQVQIGTPSSPTDWGISNSLTNNYWIGEFPITIYPENGPAVTGEAYCMTPGGTIYEGSTYTAAEISVTDVKDSGIPLQTWEEISYIMSWYAPTDGTSAAIDQVAIWMLLGQNPPYTDFYLDSSITGPAANLVTFAKANGGMNVAQSGDNLQWIAPIVAAAGNSISTSTSPGQVTFQVQLTDSSGNPLRIQNVQIDFTAFGSTTSELTNSNGIATDIITVTQTTPPGSPDEITASMHSVWPVEYLDLTHQQDQSGTQNLIGVGTTLGLTTTCNINIVGSLFVLPESAYGALSALTACAAGFVIYYKVKPRTKRPML